MAIHPYTRLFILPAPPDADNDISEGYEIGDVIHVEGGAIYDCTDNTEGAAVWVERGSGGSLPNPFALTEDITPTTLSAHVNNYNPTGLETADVLRLSSDADRTITGLQGGADGRILLLVNVGTEDILLLSQSASSSAANRFSMGADVTLGPNNAIILQYDSTASRWRGIGTNAAALQGAAITSELRAGLDGGDILIWNGISEEFEAFPLFNDLEGNPSPIGPAADGTSTYSARRDHVHAITSGSAVLASNFSITGAAGVHQATGLSVTPPSAGTYRITGNIRGALIGNAGTRWELYARLRNTTDGADIADSETLIVLTATTGVHLQNTAPIDIIITVAGAKTIEVWAARGGAGTPSWTLSQIASDSTIGRSRLMYEKIG